MDSKEYLAPSCDTVSTKAPEVQWNLRMCIPTLKEETVECLYEEESACSDNINMYPSAPSEPSKFMNYYDSKDYVFDQLKMEFHENERPQSRHNMELSKFRDKQEIKHENSEDQFSLKEENVDKMYQVTIKTERLLEQDILDNAEAITIHYDVLVTPQKVRCKLCGRIFKNSFNLLMHNNEHIKIEINTLRDNEMNESNKCQYGDRVFNNSDNMLTRVGDVHSKIKAKGKLCGKQLAFSLHPDGNINNKFTGKEDGKMRYKCDSCERVCKSKYILTMHIKRTHYDYGRMFGCWCGKQFRTPIHLRVHMRRQHDGKMKDINNYKVQCDTCQKIFKTKFYLERHIKKVHHDYGRMFECWCGKQFRTPMLLSDHKRTQHGAKKVYRCEYCKVVFNLKCSLTEHMMRVHYDYGKKFDCWCGKQFRAPIHLSQHVRRQHDGKMNDRNNDKVQCDICQKELKTKHYLKKHIKKNHYDYGRTFECRCGKQFRTPMSLSQHMRRQHGAKVNDKNSL